MLVHFQFVVESVLRSVVGDCPLPVVVYLDDIAMNLDTQKQVVEDMLEVIKQLAAAGFMPYFHEPVSPSSWASLDLGWLLGAQHHQAYHLAGEVGR